MKAFWSQQAQRINALSMRERVIMFATGALAMVAMTDAFVLSPLLAEHKQLAERTQTQTRELAALRAGLAAMARAPDAQTPQGRLRSALLAAREQRRTVDAEIEQRLAARLPVAPVAALVERVLRRHERLALVRLTLTPPHPVAPGAAVGLHGVELAISGRYPDMVAYLAELERGQPSLRWGDLHLAEGSPPTLTVQLQTLGDMP